MHENIMNEYTLDAVLGASTEWVVTFPTKNFYVDDLYLTGSQNLTTPSEYLEVTPLTTREIYSLELADILTTAREKVRTAQYELATGDTDFDARLKKFRSARRAAERAEAALEKAGGGE